MYVWKTEHSNKWILYLFKQLFIEIEIYILWNKCIRKNSTQFSSVLAQFYMYLSHKVCKYVCAGTFGDNKWMLNKKIWKHIFSLFFLKYSLFLPRSLKKETFLWMNFVQCDKGRRRNKRVFMINEILKRLSSPGWRNKRKWIELRLTSMNEIWFFERLKTNNLFDLVFCGLILKIYSWSYYFRWLYN